MKYQSSDLPEASCEQLRNERDDGDTYEELSKRHSCSILTAIRHASGDCSCSVDVDPIEDDKPWREEAVVEELFVEENMFFTEMADELGCHPETARNWVIKHEVSEVPSSHRTSSKTVRMLQRLGEEDQAEFGIDFPAVDD